MTDEDITVIQLIDRMVKSVSKTRLKTVFDPWASVDSIFGNETFRFEAYKNTRVKDLPPNLIWELMGLNNIGNKTIDTFLEHAAKINPKLSPTIWYDPSKDRIFLIQPYEEINRCSKFGKRIELLGSLYGDY